jgi:hypothetical protein
MGVVSPPPQIVIEPYGYRWYRVGGLDYLLRRTEVHARNAARAGLRDESSVRRLEYAWEKLPPSELWAIRPSSRSPIHRCKLLKVQIGEKLRSGMASDETLRWLVRHFGEG